MDKAQELRNALRAAEEVLGNTVRKYRLALGCCCSCGDYFEIGELVVVVGDEDGMTGFEHDTCPIEAQDYRSSYRNPQQLDVDKTSIT
ncbi:MAG: hypothetical protein AB7L09_00775 [Nitrospira sp.]